MEKEVLTIDRCRDELLKRYRIAPVWWVIVTVLFAGATAGFGALVAYVVSQAKEFLWVHGVAIGVLLICWMPFFCLLVVAVIESVQMKKMRLRILKSELEIVEDQLKRTYEDHETKGYGKYRQVKWIWVFVFENYGNYRMPDRWNYGWSDLHAMGSHKAWETSREGDGFYILRFKDDLTREPLQIYNMRFFWFSKDGSLTPPRGSWRDSVSIE